MDKSLPTYIAFKKAYIFFDKRVPWPGWPGVITPLSELVGQLLELKVTQEGCLSRVYIDHQLPDNFMHLLRVDHALTEAFLEVDDDEKEQYLLYKLHLDHCIQLARAYLNVLEQNK